MHASLLLLLQERALSLPELQSLYNTTAALLRPYLEYLLKHGLLTAAEEHYSVNPEFVPKRLRSKLLLLQFEELKLDSCLNLGREFAIQALMMKIMKVEKQMRHGELLERVAISMRRFRPEKPQMQAMIQKMINCDFLQEDGEYLRYIS